MFEFKKFSIRHDRSSMKVGTDSVLLGAWCDVNNAKTILDVGTGCGILALMLAQRNQDVVVDAIDIDHNSVLQAKDNFNNSPWGIRLNAIEQDFTCYKTNKKYDLIVSNPPFFSNGILPENIARTNARHTITLTYQSLILNAKSLLSNSGKIAIVAPFDCFQEILDVCNNNDLYISNIVNIKTTPCKVPKRILIEITNQPKDMVTSTLIIADTQNEYTEEFRQLCSPFYLNL